MKKIITALFLCVLLSANAQLDRSKEPKTGPVPELNLGVPQSFELNNGLKVIVVKNTKLPRVSYTLIIDNPPAVEGEKAGVGQLMGSLLGQGSTSIQKDDFNEEVDYMGASISFNPSGGSARGLSKYSSRLLELMADAALHPNFTQEEFEKEQNILLDNLKSNEKSVSAVSSRVSAALAYGLNHPYGEFISQETVKNVTLADVKEYYRNYFVPKNAYLAVVGDVDFLKLQQEVTALFEVWKKGSPPVISLSTPKDAQYTQINFIDMPNAVQSEIDVQNIMDLKMTDADFFPALLANKILGGSFRSYLNASLREDKGYTYGAGSRMRSDRYASRFTASASVRNAVTDSAVVVFMDQLERIKNEKVDPQELAIAKAEYVGEFVMALERPGTIARYALNILTEDLPDDFYTSYLEEINAVTVEDVQRAAQKFIKTDKAKIVVVGKGSEVLENLEKVTFKGSTVPIKYYTEYAVATEKPDYSTNMAEGTTIDEVLNNYITAIGGKTKLEGVQAYWLKAEAEMQGTKLELEMKKTAKNQFMQDVKVMGNSMSRQVINDGSGYMVMQGQRKDMDEAELKKARQESTPFPELNYLNGGPVLEGVEVVDGKKAYKVKVSEERTSFYDMDTGLKVQDITRGEMQGQQFTSTITYSDYQEVSGILFPFTIGQTMGPQQLEFKVKEIKVNEGVSDADFE